MTSERYGSDAVPPGNVVVPETMRWRWRMCADVKCTKCAFAAPISFCPDCRAIYEQRRRLWLDRENAKRRALRERRRAERDLAVCKHWWR